MIAKNFINETNFFEWDDKTYRKYFANANANAAEIVLPKLNEMAYEQVDLAGVTFRDFIDNKAANGEPGNFSFVLRGYVRKWMSEIDAQLEAQACPGIGAWRARPGGAATAAGGRSRRQGLIRRQCRRSGKLPGPGGRPTAAWALRQWGSREGRPVGRKPKATDSVLDRTRCGKTLTARLYGDFLLLTGRDPQVFDTAAPPGGIIDFYPERTRLVDFSRTTGQVALFDTILASPTP